MADRGSRHRLLGTYRTATSGGEEVELYEPRLTPLGELATVHQVTGADRLDLIAHRYYGDAHQYWRLVDANPALEPEELLEPGITLLVPEERDG